MIPFTPAAVIFDFDGVLINSMNIHKQAWMDAYNTLYARPFPTLDAEQLSGRSSWVIAQSICSAAGDDAGAENLLNEKNRILNTMKTPPLVPGTTQLMNDLKEKSIPFGICSNAQSYFIDQVTRQNGCSVSVITGFDNTPNPKPAPDGYIHTALQLGISPTQFEQVVIFEDSFPGITAAVNAGMYPIGICYQYSAYELRQLGAAATAQDIEEVWKEDLLNLR